MTDPEQSRTKRHVSKHKTKYALGLTAGCVLEILNITGTLGPILCSMPFVPAANREMCIAAFKATKEASQEAMKLDQGKLDDGQLMPVPKATSPVEEPPAEMAAPIPTIKQEL